MTIPMPEPIYEVGDYPSNGEVMCDCYSLEQLEAYADARVKEALESVINLMHDSRTHVEGFVFDSIQALLPPLPGPEPQS